MKKNILTIIFCMACSAAICWLCDWRTKVIAWVLIFWAVLAVGVVGATLSDHIRAKKKMEDKKRISMRLCDLDEIKVCVDRQYENCHGYSGSKKAIYREAILAVKSILHAANPVDAVEVVRCWECKYHEDSHVIGFEHCCLYDLTMRYNDFCSYGKREGGSD